MSYSFSVRAASKDEVKTMISEKMDEIVQNQQMHVHDRDAAVDAAEAFIDLVTVPEGRELTVSMNGSVGWDNSVASEDPADAKLNGAGAGVSVQVV